MKARCFSAVVLAGLLGSLAAASAAESAGWLEKLKGVPDGDWRDTGAAYAYTGEVPLAYSPDHRLLFRYGGCTCGRGGYEDYSYANDFWVMNAENGKWDQRRAVHMYGCQKRPQAGCSRTFCYDRKRKVLWLCHGIGNYGIGATGMAAYDPVRDTFTIRSPRDGHGGDSTMMCYDPVHDLVVRVTGGVTLTFDPNNWTWKPGAATPPGAGMYRSVACDEDSGRVLLVTDGPKGWQPGQSAPKPGEAFERAMRTWAYDAAADKWAELAPGGDVPEPRSNFVIAWDRRNKVLFYHAAGSGDGEGDAGKASQTYVLDLKANAWKKQEPKTVPPPRQIKASAVYDENHNVILSYINGRIWAYRYRGGFPEDRR